MTATPQFEPLIATVAAYGLKTRHEFPTSPLEPPAWKPFLFLCKEYRIGLLLSRAIADGALPVTETQRGEAILLANMQAMTVMAIEQALVEVATAFDDAGLPYRVLKGSALARAVYPDPGIRAFGDLDLLVPSDSFDQAAAVLLAQGCERTRVEPRPGFVARYGKGAAFRRPDNLHVDLHRTLLDGPFSFRINPDVLFADRAMFVVNGRSLPTLVPEARFVHACCHAGLGDIPPKIVPMRDVFQTLIDSKLEISGARALWEEWGLQSLVARALTRTWTDLQLTQSHPLHQWAASFTPSQRDQRLIDLYFERHGDFDRRSVIATVREIPGVRLRGRYLAAMLFPDAAYRATHGGLWSRVRRGVQILFRGARRPRR